MSGQTYETRIVLPKASDQSRARAASRAAGRLGSNSEQIRRTLDGAGIGRGHRIVALIEASASIARPVTGTLRQEGSVTSVAMRAGPVRFVVELEEDERGGTSIARAHFQEAYGATCAEEAAIYGALVASWAEGGFQPAQHGGPTQNPTATTSTPRQSEAR